MMLDLKKNSLPLEKAQGKVFKERERLVERMEKSKVEQEVINSSISMIQEEKNSQEQKKIELETRIENLKLEIAQIETNNPQIIEKHNLMQRLKKDLSQTKIKHSTLQAKIDEVDSQRISHKTNSNQSETKLIPLLSKLKDLESQKSHAQQLHFPQLKKAEGYFILKKQNYDVDSPLQLADQVISNFEACSIDKEILHAHSDVIRKKEASLLHPTRNDIDDIKAQIKEKSVETLRMKELLIANMNKENNGHDDAKRQNPHYKQKFRVLCAELKELKIQLKASDL